MRTFASPSSRTRLLPKAPALVLAGALALAGCGGSSKSSSTSSTPSTSASTTAAPPATGRTLSLAANPEGLLKYNTTSLTAKAGSISIAFTNSASLMHNVTVADSSGKVVGATATFSGGTRILPLNLKAGVYKFYCSVPGHRMAGMEGTLTVQ